MIDPLARWQELYPSHVCRVEREHEAVRILAAEVRREAMLECAEIADKADDLTGGVYGGPSSCIHGCGEVIAEAIRARMEGK